MTTGRINQVTFLSDQGLGSQPQGAGELRHKVTRKGPKPLGVVYNGQTSDFCVHCNSEAGLFGFSDNLHYAAHRTKQRSE